MDKIQVMRLVYESNLNKYEKLFLLDFVYNEPEESIPFVIQEFSLGSVSKTLKRVFKKGKKIGKEFSKGAKKAYYSAGAKVGSDPVWSRLAQYPAAAADVRPGSHVYYPQVNADIAKGLSWAAKKFSKGK